MRSIHIFITIICCFFIYSCIKSDTSLNANDELLNFSYDGIFYHEYSEGNYEYYDIDLNESKINELNIILEKNTWELDKDPVATGFLHGYGLLNQNKIIVYFSYYENKMCIIIKNPDNGDTTAVYWASIEIYKNIELFYKNNL